MKENQLALTKQCHRKIHFSNVGQLKKYKLFRQLAGSFRNDQQNCHSYKMAC